MPTEENVSDYPRPPLIELVNGGVSVLIADEIIAEDTRYVRVCETFHPPTIYINPKAFIHGSLQPISRRGSFCEWKGIAEYWSLSKADGSDSRPSAGWSYPRPTDRFHSLRIG